MFTGIIEEIGALVRLWRNDGGYLMQIQAETVLEDTKLGDSIAVQGVCLTVTHLDSHTFTVGLAPETRQRTNLMNLRPGHRVNLERALTPTSRMGGHFVQGHVDGVGTLRSLKPEGDSLWLDIQAPPDLMRLIVPKGFVALDGVSLTVVDVDASSFRVMLVDYTQSHITLSHQRPGYQVNIELDVLGKYVEKLLQDAFKQSPSIDRAFLARFGFTA